MSTREEELAHLKRLADELEHRGFAVDLADQRSKPQLTVANAEMPALFERVVCTQAEDGSWGFWWPWKQPIGSVDDLETVVSKIASVLRSVEGA